MRVLEAFEVSEKLASEGRECEIEFGGKVIAVVRDRDGARATVSVDAAAICPRCAAGKGCGAGIFGASKSVRRIEVSLAPGLEVSEGQVSNVVALGKQGVV